ncbi:MAG: sulfatase-like hydrolase/transferase [Kiritimatiellae bacterium]|nr:sulfatase-like hydrolase/transferase [Kiritimatiellia bacterium]
MPRHTLRRLTFALLSVLPTACYPVLFVYFHNAAEAPLSQVWHPLAVFVAFAAGFYLLFTAMARDAIKAALLTNTTLLLFANYSAIESLIRDINWHARYWHILPALSLAVALAAVRLRRLHSRATAGIWQINTIVATVFTLLILLNFAQATPTLIAKGRLAHRGLAARPSTAGQRSAIPHHLPNVYYILLDEYSSFDMIQKHYGYDNSAFASLLQSSGFNVSYTSRNPSFYTSEVLAYLISMSATNIPSSVAVGGKDPMGARNHAAAVYGAIKSESRLTRFFESHGYRTYVADMYHLFFNNPYTLHSDVAYALDGKTRASSHANSILGIVAARSVLNYMIEGSSSNRLYNRLVEGILQWLTEQTDADPVFLFAHILCPHGPFAFDRDGKPITGGLNWEDKSLYLGQYIFITARMSSVLHSLIARDPDCVIILQSDHSARIWAEGKDYSDLPIADMTPILNAVYFQGKSLSINGLSGLDTGLTVYHELFGSVTPN